MRAISPHTYIFGSDSSSPSTSISGPSTKNSSSTLTSPPLPPRLFHLALSKKTQTYLQIGSLLGLAAYIIPSPTARLALVATANALAAVRMALLWAGVAEGEGAGEGYAEEQGIRTS